MNTYRWAVVYILLIAHIPSLFAELTVDASRPYSIQTAHEYPLTAFFRSLFALKEIPLGNYPIKAQIEGWINLVGFRDSRQVIATADGLRLFAPRREKLDPNGEDINSVGEYNMTIIETRPRVKLYGPEVLGAESFGLIELDFIGNEALIGLLRSRHAYLKLTWKEHKASLWLGKYFLPLRLAHLDLDPKVLSRNRAAPIHPSGFFPQIRFTKGWDNYINMVFTMLTELRSTSFGPEGPSSIYTRRSMMPIFNLQFWLGPMSTKYVFGVGFEVKRLVPRLVTNECIETRETLTSSSFTAFAKITAEPLSVRTQFAWVQNGTDYSMLGGYAVSSIDPITDKRTYANINVLSYWIDFNLDKRISPGLLGGFTKNLGTSNNCIITSETNAQTGDPESLVYARGPDIKYMAKLMPRIRIHKKPMVFAAELEWTRAGYGTLQTTGKINNVTPVSNVRLLFATFFFF